MVTNTGSANLEKERWRLKLNEQEWTVNDMRLGDLDALLDKFLRSYTEQEKVGNFQFVACEIKQNFADMVCEQPTIDAVPVVRCKECRHCRDYADSEGNAHLYCTGYSFDLDVYPTDFCSCGERKDGA